ncbi:MAG: hypothetical protein ACR2OO_05200, partial [Thermomicrobiales bacterium]
IAEAVFEHRNILGTSHDAIALLQAGIVNGDRVSVLVVGGVAAAVSRGIPAEAAARTLGLAEFAAAALHAQVIAVDIASIDGEAVVWDVHPIPEFREMIALGARSAAEAIADVVVGRLDRLADRDPVAVAGPRTMSLAGFEAMTELRREVADGFVLTA